MPLLLSGHYEMPGTFYDHMDRVPRDQEVYFLIP